MSGAGVIALLMLAGCSAADDVPAPMIASVVPDHGPAGAIVAVSGAYFCQLPDTGNEDPTCDAIGTVHFGTTSGTPTSWSDTSILVEVPAVTGRVALSVTVKGRTSNSVEFTGE